MRKKLLYIFLLTSITVCVKAQNLGEFKPADKSYGLNKLKGGKASRIYISAFNVIYQVYNEKQDFKQGGSQLGGGYKGDAQAEASIGLEGLTDADVQKITDKLYTDYVAMLKAKGLTIIDIEEAAKTDAYADMMRVQGGKISLAQFPGTMTSTPAGFSYFIKKIDKDGKEKKGGLLNNPAMIYPKLSSQLNDAIIADVNLYVLFVEDKNAFRGNGANIKIATNLRLAGTEAIIMTDDSKGLKFKGQNTISTIASAVNFYHGKMGMGSTSFYGGTLSKSLGIGGVIEDTKVQSAANRSVDAGVKTIYGTYYSPQNKNSKTSKLVEVDPAKYESGVYLATKKFMEHHTREFLQSF